MMQPLETFERQPTLLLSRAGVPLMNHCGILVQLMCTAVTVASIMAEAIVSGVNNAREGTEVERSHALNSRDIS